MSGEPMMLTIKSAIQQTGLSRSQIYRWLNDGTIAGKKVGRSTYIRWDSLLAAIASLPDYR